MQYSTEKLLDDIDEAEDQSLTDKRKNTKQQHLNHDDGDTKAKGLPDDMEGIDSDKDNAEQVISGTDSVLSRESEPPNQDDLAQRRVTMAKDPKIQGEKERSVAIGTSKRVYGNNFIKTHKYTLVTFVPLNLFEQFTQVANMYFLLIAVLQCLPDVSITKQIPIILLPLSFIILITAVKDILEDLKRYNSDKEENRTNTEVLRGGKRKRVLWESVYPGDIVLIKRGETVPADCLLLYSSETELNICYVETKSLDGETNLKKKIVASDGSTFQSEQECLEHYTGSEVTFERENPNLTSFEGRLHGPDGAVPLSAEHLLIRGSSLRNTDYVFAVALSVG